MNWCYTTNNNAGLEIATHTVANATKTFLFANTKFGLVAKWRLFSLR